MSLSEKQTTKGFYQLAAVAFLFFFTCSNTSVNAQNETIDQVVRASEDARMYDQMTKISQAVNMYCMLNHRFPEEGDEMKAETEQLNQLIPNPPYRPRSLLLAPGLDVDPLYAQPELGPSVGELNPDTGTTLDRVHLIFDPSLTELEIQGWRTDPPVDWQEPPGTVTAISNNQNIFVIWGAGADGLPLRNQYTKRTMMIIGRYAMLYDTQE